ncbi:MAG: hypothetical protein QXN34_04895 [Archaeoglobaceae archaeon]
MKFILVALLFLGALDSGYLFYVNYLPYTLPYCPINFCVPLDLPLPPYILALLGLLWFLSGFVLFFLIKSCILIRTWQVLGILGATSLFLFSLYIGYYCPYCYAAHFFGFISSLLSWKSNF